MEWLVDGADLFAYELGSDLLRLELILSGGGTIPVDPAVVLLELRDPVSEQSLEEELQIFKHEGLWAVGREESAGQTSVVLQGEGYDVQVATTQLTVLRAPMERRHYEPLLETAQRCERASSKKAAQAQAQLRHLEQFVTGQIERAQRILTLSAPGPRQAHTKADARVKALREVMNILKGSSED